MWGSVEGLFLDKGFNVKFTYNPKFRDLPNIAIGLDDFAGTGLFTREYVTFTKVDKYYKATLGMGWGNFTGENEFKNPLSYLDDYFLNRPIISSNYDKGGTPSYDQWFAGPASLFGGLEILIPQGKGLKLKLEYDPFDYNKFGTYGGDSVNRSLRKKDSNFNYGLSFPHRYGNIDISYLKGNTLNLSLNFALQLNDKIRKKNEYKPEIIKDTAERTESSFYLDLLKNLNNNNLFLQSADLDKKTLKVAISTSQYRDPVQSSYYAGSIASDLAEQNDIDLNSIEITDINFGVEINKISYINNHLKKGNNIPIELVKKQTSIKVGKNESFKKNKFLPRVIFPQYFGSINPTIISYIGNPQKAYVGGLAIQHSSETQFSRNLILYSDLNYVLADNFNDVPNFPDSLLPHVRTEILSYLQESKFNITNLELNYLWSPKKNVYAKINTGLLESMYGGIGGEIIYKPFDGLYTIGLESYLVKRRGYKQDFKFLDYKTTTSHLNLGYHFPNTGIQAKLSFGKYLAKDLGYTFDISRRTKHGFTAGIYFTRTNVSAEEFGEGSFDKGFYFKFPIDLFSKDHNSGYAGFQLSPLTRDGGAKLNHSHDLLGILYNSSRYEIERNWFKAKK